MKPTLLENIPVPIFNDSSSQKEKYIRISQCVAILQENYKKIVNLRVDQERSIIQRQIDTYENEINSLVYQLYQLNADDIENIEKEI